MSGIISNIECKKLKERDSLDCNTYIYYLYLFVGVFSNSKGFVIIELKRGNEFIKTR